MSNPPLASLHTSTSHIELVNEFLRTIEQWLEDIWEATFVWRDGYEECHRGLLEILKMMRRLAEVPGLTSSPKARANVGCGCLILNSGLDITLRKPKRSPFTKHLNVQDPPPAKPSETDDPSLTKVVKRWSLSGPQELPNVLLWIWRDLFVSLFAHSSEETKGKDNSEVYRMIQEMAQAMGIDSLHKVLRGGVGGKLPQDFLLTAAH
jgi:hypothetical protein